jgi:hypothetical protein
VVGLTAEVGLTDFPSRVKRALQGLGIDMQRDGRTGILPDGTPLLCEWMRSSHNPDLIVVNVSMSGEALNYPPWVEIDVEEQRRCESVRAITRAIFERLVGVDSLYIGVAIEWTMPLPEELVNNDCWLPGDFWWSVRLGEGTPTLLPNIEVAMDTRAVPYGNGLLITSGGILDPKMPIPEALIRAGKAVGKAVAIGLMQFMPPYNGDG